MLLTAVMMGAIQVATYGSSARSVSGTNAGVPGSGPGSLTFCNKAVLNTASWASIPSFLSSEGAPWIAVDEGRRLGALFFLAGSELFSAVIAALIELSSTTTGPGSCWALRFSTSRQKYSAIAAKPIQAAA